MSPPCAVDHGLAPRRRGLVRVVTIRSDVEEAGTVEQRDQLSVAIPRLAVNVDLELACKQRERCDASSRRSGQVPGRRFRESGARRRPAQPWGHRRACRRLVRLRPGCSIPGAYRERHSCPTSEITSLASIVPSLESASRMPRSNSLCLGIYLAEGAAIETDQAFAAVSPGHRCLLTGSGRRRGEAEGRSGAPDAGTWAMDLEGSMGPVGDDTTPARCELRDCAEATPEDAAAFGGQDAVHPGAEAPGCVSPTGTPSPPARRRVLRRVSRGARRSGSARTPSGWRCDR